MVMTVIVIVVMMMMMMMMMMNRVEIKWRKADGENEWMGIRST